MNLEVLQRVEITRIETMLLKIKLSWAGHVSRMEDYCLPKIVLCSELFTGHGDRGYKDSLKKSLNSCNIDQRQRSMLAEDSDTWRHTVQQVTYSFKSSRRATRGKGEEPVKGSNSNRTDLLLQPL